MKNSPEIHEISGLYRSVPVRSEVTFLPCILRIHACKVFYKMNYVFRIPLISLHMDGPLALVK